MSERIGTDTAEVLPGSFGADLILGLGGNDLIDGNAGSDTLSGNAGVDTIFGGLDNDFVLGGQDNDLLYGDGGNDTIFGNKGNDAIEGGDGNDVIFGGKDDDVINGGSGSDVIWGDLGVDSLVGGSGADVFVLTRSSGGATLEEADTIVDFVPGLDTIGLADSIDSKSLNITFQAIANSSVKANVIVQDLGTGQILAVIENVSRSEFLSNNIFTTVLANSSSVDIGEVPGSETDSDGGDGSGDGSTVNTVTRDSVGKSAPLTTNTTIVTFEGATYSLSKNDFSFFDIDGDAFSSVRILSLPGQGDLFTTATATDATTGVTTTTKTAIVAGASIPVANLSSLIFVPDPDTRGADYGSFSFQVSDGANLSNVGTAAIIVKAGSAPTIGETNEAPPTIDAADITTAAKEPENGGNTKVRLFDSIKLFDDSGKLTSVTVALSGGSPAAGEDVLSVAIDDLPSGITPSDVVNRTLTLSGSASVADYKKAIELIKYTNTVNSTSKSDRTVKLTINDGLNAAVSKDYTLKVAANDDAIEIKNVNESNLTAIEDAGISATNPATVYVFADSPDLAFEDPDTTGGSVEISSIVVSLASGFLSTTDSLSSSGSAGIAFTSGGSGSTLVLTPPSGSSATASQYAEALKTIQFKNTSDTPDTISTRQISIKINSEPASIVNNINIKVAKTNDPPAIGNSTLSGGTYTIPTNPVDGSLTFNVADLVGSSYANASDRDSSSLGLGITAVNSGATSGTWSYSLDGTNFTDVTSISSPVTISSSGKVKFSGATSPTRPAPSLTFKAWDETDVSSGAATLSLTVQKVVESGAPDESINADPSGKVIIVYDALTDATDTITNFNPTEDVLRFQGLAFKTSTIIAGGINTATTPTKTLTADSVSSSADIIFFSTSADTNFTTGGDLDSFIENQTLQNPTIIAHRTPGGSVRIWYVEDGLVPVKTQMAQLSGVTLSALTASNFDFI